MKTSFSGALVGLGMPLDLFLYMLGIGSGMTSESMFFFGKSLLRNGCF